MGSRGDKAVRQCTFHIARLFRRLRAAVNGGRAGGGCVSDSGGAMDSIPGSNGMDPSSLCGIECQTGAV